MRQFWILPEIAVITIAKLLVATAVIAGYPKATCIGTKIVPPPIPKKPARIPENRPPITRSNQFEGSIVDFQFSIFVETFVLVEYLYLKIFIINNIENIIFELAEAKLILIAFHVHLFVGYLLLG
jgi:hypothetical protein